MANALLLLSKRLLELETEYEALCDATVLGELCNTLTEAEAFEEFARTGDRLSAPFRASETEPREGLEAEIVTRSRILLWRRIESLREEVCKRRIDQLADAVQSMKEVLTSVTGDDDDERFRTLGEERVRMYESDLVMKWGIVNALSNFSADHDALTVLLSAWTMCPMIDTKRLFHLRKSV